MIVFHFRGYLYKLSRNSSAKYIRVPCCGCIIYGTGFLHEPFGVLTWHENLRHAMVCMPSYVKASQSRTFTVFPVSHVPVSVLRIPGSPVFPERPVPPETVYRSDPLCQFAHTFSAVQPIGRHRSSPAYLKIIISPVSDAYFL